MIASRLKLVLALLALLVAGCASCKKDGPHSVTLTWQISAPGPKTRVVGYNVYRRTMEGDHYVRIATQVPGPPYEDRMVMSGRTYSYVVTAVDESGRESRFSTDVRATVP